MSGTKVLIKRDKSLFFKKMPECLHMCKICSKFGTPLFARQTRNPPNIRSHFAGHMGSRGHFFENGPNVPAFVHTEQLSVSKLPIVAQYAQIRDKSLFFQKNARMLAYVQNL